MRHDGTVAAAVQTGAGGAVDGQGGAGAAAAADGAVRLVRGRLLRRGALLGEAVGVDQLAKLTGALGGDGELKIELSLSFEQVFLGDNDVALMLLI